MWTKLIHTLQFLPCYFSSHQYVLFQFNFRTGITEMHNMLHLDRYCCVIAIYQSVQSTQQVSVESLPRDSMTLYQVAAEQVSPTLGIRRDVASEHSSWHLESRWTTQWWTEIVSRGRLGWRCGAVWDALWGWQGSARPISRWQLQRLENHQTSSAIHIWMAAV